MGMTTPTSPLLLRSSERFSLRARIPGDVIFEMDDEQWKGLRAERWPL